MRDSRLLHEITTYYNHLLYLEECYEMNNGNRRDIHKNILIALDALTMKFANLGIEFKEMDEYWKYHAIGNRKYIELSDGLKFMNILLLLANSNLKKYEIKNIKVYELLPQEGRSIYYAKFKDVCLLADNDVLDMFVSDRYISHISFIEKLEDLANNGKSFVFLNNLISNFLGIYDKEKMATSDGNDLILSINDDSVLDDSINKLVCYMTKYGSDFSNINSLKLANTVSKEQVKKRILDKNNYIKYNEE